MTDAVSGAELDARLRAALQSAHDPVVPPGIADLIRARVERGDAGTVEPGPVAPGWSSAAPRIWLVVFAIVTALLLVVAGLFIGGRAAGWWSGAGAPGEPVVLITESSAPPSPIPIATHTATRTPTATPTSTPTASPVLPPAPPPAPEPDPEPAPDPVPPPDTVPPAVYAVSASPDPVYIANWTGTSPAGATVTVLTDADAVGVTVAWSGGTGGAASVSAGGGGGTWTAFIPASASGTGTIILTATAIDAAGNTASGSGSVQMVM